MRFLLRQNALPSRARISLWEVMSTALGVMEFGPGQTRDLPCILLQTDHRQMSEKRIIDSLRVGFSACFVHEAYATNHLKFQIWGFFKFLIVVVTGDGVGNVDEEEIRVP